MLETLQSDQKLKSIIVNHEALLQTLRDNIDLKAEQMLMILTVAETEAQARSKKSGA